VDLESVADELYSLPREEFTAARNAAAGRARAHGHRGLAEQIGALRRPSTAAWLANRLAREHPEQVRALRQLGDGLRAAQRQGHGDELRRLSQQRHELIHAIVQQVRALAGHPVSEAISDELVNTFTAAVNSSSAAQALAGGHLTVALDPADAAAELFAGAGAAGPSRGAPDSGTDRVRQRIDPGHRDLDRLRKQAADADTARDDAQRALTDAEQALADATATLRELRARLEAAEQVKREAHSRIRTAQRSFDAADQLAREAHQRVCDLEHTMT
jgi:paraquat-inducible protein B